MYKFILPDTIKYIIDLFLQNSFECYVAGGALRDFIRADESGGECSISDYDLATNALPEEIISLCEHNSVKYYKYGIKHGTITLILNKMNIEITTYRAETGYLDSRHPDSVSFIKNLRKDAMRRDFTINAMYYNDYENLIDYFDGVNDIKNGIIRTVGNSNERFDEDALRIMRAVRFASTLEYDIEENTFESIIKLKNNLNNISKERISSELCKIITCDNILRAMTLLRDTVMDVVLPELMPCTDTPQNHPHHLYNVFDHTAHAMENIISSEISACNLSEYDFLILRIAAMLHDSGKPMAHTTDSDGTDHFKGHADYSIMIAKKVLSRLRFDKKFINDVIILIKYHDIRTLTNKYEIKKLMNIIGKRRFKMLLYLQKADCSAQNFKDEKLKKLESVKAMYNEIINNNECYKIQNLDFKGSDVLEYNYTGVEIKKELERLLEIVMETPEKNKREILINYIKRKKL